MERLSAGIYQTTSGYVNGYLIDGDDGVTLVDTGLPGKLEAIKRALVGIGRSIEDVTTIVITHGHADHFGSASAAKHASGASLVASKIDAPVIRGDQPPQPPPFAEKYSFLKPIISRLPAPEGVEVDLAIAGDQPIELVSDLSAIQTPGHTEGHMSLLLDRADGVLFVGDAAVADKSGNIKRGFMNLSGEIFDNSLRKIAAHEFSTAYFGHSAPIVGGASGAFARFVASL